MMWRRSFRMEGNRYFSMMIFLEAMSLRKMEMDLIPNWLLFLIALREVRINC